jgi:hypothetical protein
VQVQNEEEPLQRPVFVIIATCYISYTEAAECDAYSGPSGAKQCVKQLGYNYDYQCMGYLPQKRVHQTNDKRRVRMRKPVGYILPLSMYVGFV